MVNYLVLTVLKLLHLSQSNLIGNPLSYFFSMLNLEHCLVALLAFPSVWCQKVVHIWRARNGLSRIFSCLSILLQILYEGWSSGYVPRFLKKINALSLFVSSNRVVCI